MLRDESYSREGFGDRHDWQFDMGPNYSCWYCTNCTARSWGPNDDPLDDDTYEPQEACGHYAY